MKINMIGNFFNDLKDATEEVSKRGTDYSLLIFDNGYLVVNKTQLIKEKK